MRANVREVIRREAAGATTGDDSVRDTTSRSIFSPTGRAVTRTGAGGEQVTLRYCDQVYRFLYSRVGNREDAEYLTEEVFLRAIPQLDGRRSTEDLSQRLFRVSDTVLDEYWCRYDGSGAVFPFGDGRKGGQGEEPSRADPQGDSDTLVQQVLASLPDMERKVLELRLLHDSSIQETARELGMTPDSVPIIQHRALGKAVQIAKDGP